MGSGQFPAGGVQFRLAGGEFPLALAEFLLGGVGLLLQGRGLFPDPLDLGSPAEQPRVAPFGTAGQGAACVDHLAVQAHHPQAVARPLGDGGGAVQVLCHGHPAQQGIPDLVVLRFTRTQAVGHPHKPWHLPDVPGVIGASPDGGQGKERGPAPVPLL